MRRAAAFLTLALVGWAGLAATAGAGSRELLWSFPVAEHNVLAHCNGFDVVDHVSGHVDVTVWYDKDGLPRRMVMDNRGVHTLYNSVSGFFVDSRYHRKFMTDVDAQRTHVVGPAYHVTVPGVGAVLFETGTIKFENGVLTHLSGRHDIMDGGLDRLCAAFA